jgi:hypothetical protein
VREFVEFRDVLIRELRAGAFGKAEEGDKSND